MILAAFALLVVAFALAMWIGARRQQAALTEQVERLVQAGDRQRRENDGGDLSLGKVPPPVARYLRLALPSTTTIRQVRIQQVGVLRTDVNSQRWTPFEA